MATNTEHSKIIAEQDAKIKSLEKKVDLYEKDVEVFTDIVVNGGWD